FNNLPVNAYSVKIKDAAGCIDSIPVNIIQAFPDLVISNTAITPASCSGNADGTATLTMTGGNSPYLYSSDGLNYQSPSTLNLHNNNYTITVKDANGCTAATAITIPLDNTVTVDAEETATICEGTQYNIRATSNATTFNWVPNGTLQHSTTLTPTASPTSN